MIEDGRENCSYDADTQLLTVVLPKEVFVPLGPGLMHCVGPWTNVRWSRYADYTAACAQGSATTRSVDLGDGL